MSEVQRVNVTIPKELFSSTKNLVDKGIFTTFSEAVTESLKKLRDDVQSPEEKKRILAKWLRESKNYDIDLSHLSQEEVLKRIHKTRDRLWDEKHTQWFK